MTKMRGQQGPRLGEFDWILPPWHELKALKQMVLDQGDVFVDGIASKIRRETLYGRTFRH
jgi:hypothetical protein